MSVLIGICGGSGSGKSTLAQRIVDRVRAERGSESAVVLSFDSYYHDQAHLPIDDRAMVNYDHPDSLDHDLLVEHLRHLRLGQSVAVPVYDFARYTRSGQLRMVDAAEVVVVEGILLFAFDAIRDELDFRVFRRCPEEVRFERRTERDLAERGRSLDSIAHQLVTTVKPMHDRYVEPYVAEADFVTDHGQDLDLMADQVVTFVTNLIGTGS